MQKHARYLGLGLLALALALYGGCGGSPPGAAPNTPPVAEDDAEETDVDTPVQVNVLDNDTDADGNDLEVTDASDPDNGTVVIGPGGAYVTYTPDGGFEGEDTFTYRAYAG